MVDLMESPLLQKWLSEAEQRGERQMLVKLLSRKFGPLPEAVAEQLATITERERLEQLMDVAIDATSLEDFCSHPGSGVVGLTVTSTRYAGDQGANVNGCRHLSQ